MDSELHNLATLSRKDREREQHRIAILDAAERVFVRDGMSTKIETISHEAEFAVGTIYNFFSSKNDLFMGVLLRVSLLHYQEMRRVIEAIQSEPWEGFGRVVREWFQHHIQHGDFLHIAISQRLKPGGVSVFDGAIEAKLKENGEKYDVLMERYFETLRHLPQVREQDGKVMHIVFEGYTRTVLHRFIRDYGMEAVKIEELTERVTRELRGVFGRGEKEERNGVGK